jgi:hypothetical protein
MIQYKLTENGNGILKLEDSVAVCWIPESEANSDWRAYQTWLAADPENNVPEPAE